MLVHILLVPSRWSGRRLWPSLIPLPQVAPRRYVGLIHERMACRNHAPITQIPETSHSPEASESVPHSEDNVQVASVSLELVPEPVPTETSVSEPDQNAQNTQEAGKPEDGEAGPAPSSHPDQQPSSSATIGSTPTTSEAEPAAGGSAEKEKEREKDKESSMATLSLTIPSLRKRTRRRDDRSTTEGKYAASHTTEGSPSLTEDERKPKKTKASLLAKITHIFTSCVAPSPRTHAVDLDEGPSSHGRADQKDPEKHSTKDVEMTEQQPSREASSSTSTGMEISRTLSSSCFLTPTF